MKKFIGYVGFVLGTFGSVIAIIKFENIYVTISVILLLLSYFIYFAFVFLKDKYVNYIICNDVKVNYQFISTYFTKNSIFSYLQNKKDEIDKKQKIAFGVSALILNSNDELLLIKDKIDNLDFYKQPGSQYRLYEFFSEDNEKLSPYEKILNCIYQETGIPKGHIEYIDIFNYNYKCDTNLTNMEEYKLYFNSISMYDDNQISPIPIIIEKQVKKNNDSPQLTFIDLIYLFKTTEMGESVIDHSKIEFMTIDEIEMYAEKKMIYKDLVLLYSKIINMRNTSLKPQIKYTECLYTMKVRNLVIDFAYEYSDESNKMIDRIFSKNIFNYSKIIMQNITCENEENINLFLSKFCNNNKCTNIDISILAKPDLDWNSNFFIKLSLKLAFNNKNDIIFDVNYYDYDSYHSVNNCSQSLTKISFDKTVNFLISCHKINYKLKVSNIELFIAHFKEFFKFWKLVKCKHIIIEVNNDTMIRTLNIINEYLNNETMDLSYINKIDICIPECTFDKCNMSSNLHIINPLNSMDCTENGCKSCPSFKRTS